MSKMTDTSRTEKNIMTLHENISTKFDSGVLETSRIIGDEPSNPFEVVNGDDEETIER